MIVGLLVLLACQLAGEFVVRLFAVPVPGAVVGMVLLLLILKLLAPDEKTGIAHACRRLLQNMQLLFIPAGVGVVQYLAVIGAALGPIAAGLVLSWLAAVVMTAVVAAGSVGLMGIRRA